VPFPIIDITHDPVVSDEQLGSKSKFWISRDNQRWLFKEARASTGEDWAEKIAGEIARLLNLDAATVELAVCANHPGCLSRSFVNADENLVHGNEILAGLIVGYDRQKRLRQSDHTFENITNAIRKLVKSVPRSVSADALLRDIANYLIFDALICNTDRHHENWGFLMRIEPVGPNKWVMHLRLAPSFDHASSLGRELQDSRRLEFLTNSRIGKYASKGRGGIYCRRTDAHGTNPIRLVEVLAQEFPHYFCPGIEALARVSISSLQNVVDEVPAARMSPVAKHFAKSLLAHTHGTLAGLRT
jgi:hypothetical protein